jgi:eukaryotic-like serine/threonine-protein kinase
MSLSLNTRFGSYLVAESIGVGGMGEVYRATDTNLKREVAIKVLPESFAQDADRLARFQREAEVLASLNHVNIAHIYGLERSENITALVMELVEGPTLAERLEQGPIPVDEALGIAMQIAEALEAAHERGIVHRDLKPANIKLRQDGAVKVLDFGIAKALDTHVGHSGSHSPALTTPAMTEAGIVLGTAAYMSPEQARGKAVDQRADIWAFGCVLYEMLSGQPAFGAEDVTTTLARILERNVDLNALPATLSLDARQAIKLCLQKDPKKRVADIRDVKLALTGAFETGTGLNTAALATTAAHGRLGWSAFAVSLVVIAALAFPALQHLREEVPRESRVDIVTPASNQPADFALSPDGSRIVFVVSDDRGGSQLWLRSMDSATAQPLAGTDRAKNPFWSPDGRAIGFFAGSVLKRIDPGGGAPQILAETNGDSLGGSWGSDNTLMFSVNSANSLLRIPATGGEAIEVTTVEAGQRFFRNPYFLPDGQQFLFSVAGMPDTIGIYLGYLDGTPPVRLTAAGSAGVYHPDGWLLWTQTGALTAQRLDLAQAALTGEPLTLAVGLTTDELGLSALSVSNSGLIAYRTGSATGRQLTWVDRSGAVLGTLGESDITMSNPRLSPDGRRVAVDRTVQGNRDIWLLDGARSTRFTFDAAEAGVPIWSPEGNRILFRSQQTPGRPYDLYLKPSSGAVEETTLLSSDQELKTPSSWSADGRFLLYHAISPNSDRDLWVVPMTGDPVPFPVLQTPFNERWGAFSPDGRWIAYQSDESGRHEVYVRAFDPDASVAARIGQWQISTEGGLFPLWSSDGQELYYIDPAGNMVAAPIMVTDDMVEVGTPERLFPARIVGGGTEPTRFREYDVAPDGRFLINRLVSDGGADPITLIQNWNPGAVK